MKKINFGLYVIIAIMLAGCSFTENVSNNINSNVAANSANNLNGDIMNNENTKQLTYKMKAVQLYIKIKELYGVNEQSLFLEHYPLKADDRAVSFLWPFSGMLSAVNALGVLPEMKDMYDNELEEIVKGLEKYSDDLRQPPAYQSYPFEFGGDDRFYDDNMWIGLDFLAAYKLTGDSLYLEKCQNIFSFIKSGWSEELGGGIFWCEQKKDTKNTCSNGPASVLALELYKATGDEDFFEWGLKIYDWTRRNLKSPENVYWDHIKLDGTTDRATFAYNTGTMLHSAVLLYQLTSKESYLEEAQSLAKASLSHFAPERANGKRFFPDENPWFTVILFRGYQALYDVDKNSEYIDAVISNADYAWEHARDGNGLISRDWSGESQEDRDARWLLDEACMAELYARAALLKE